MIQCYLLEKFGLMREAILCLATSEPDLYFVGASAYQADFDLELSNSPIDVLLLDMDLETEKGHPLSACHVLCARIQEKFPNVKVVLHSSYRHASWMRKFTEVGVLGFVSKHSRFDMIVAAIKSAHKGELFVCPVIIEQFSNFPAFLKNPKVELRLKYPAFSAREAEVLALLSQGRSTRYIADKLFLSEKTIETHRRNLIIKAKVQNTAELINFVSVRGLIQQ